MNKYNLLTTCQNLTFGSYKYLAVLTKKIFGGFDLAVLANLMTSLASVDALSGRFTFCTLERFFILSQTKSSNVYGNY
jgi:hypothetical protein